MPEGDILDIQETVDIKLPCGDILTVKKNSEGNREYWYKNKMVWCPAEFHRTGFIAALLHEDGQKYLEKNKINPLQNNL